LAGPVTVACVSLPPRDPHSLGRLLHRLQGLGDPKRVTPRNPERLFAAIGAVFSWSVGCASAAEIDEIGIVEACRRSARRAYRGLMRDVNLCLLDRGLTLPQASPVDGVAADPRLATLTKADAHSFHVAAASIVAKVWRDRLMSHLDVRFPGYGLGRHKGYGTAEHRNLIAERGPSSIHRRTFTQGLQVAESQSC